MRSNHQEDRRRSFAGTRAPEAATGGGWARTLGAMVAVATLVACSTWGAGSDAQEEEGRRAVVRPSPGIELEDRQQLTAGPRVGYFNDRVVTVRIVGDRLFVEPERVAIYHDPLLREPRAPRQVRWVIVCNDEESSWMGAEGAEMERSSARETRAPDRVTAEAASAEEIHRESYIRGRCLSKDETLVIRPKRKGEAMPPSSLELAPEATFGSNGGADFPGSLLVPGAYNSLVSGTPRLRAGTELPLRWVYAVELYRGEELIDQIDPELIIKDDH